MLLLTLSLSIASCTTIPDIDICVELEKDKRGHCIHAVSEKQFPVDNVSKFRKKQTWLQTKQNSLIIPSDSWAELKAYIISMCKKTNACDKHTTRWRETINTIDQYNSN